MSSHRIEPPESISELLIKAEERGRRTARIECAEIVGMYPIEHMFYDDQDITHEEIIRFRDTLSEACIKVRTPGHSVP